MSDAASTRLISALRHMADALIDLRTTWALVGGLAVSIRAEPRFTRDLDVAVAVADDHEAERLVSELVARGFRLRISLEQQALGRLAAVRLLPPGEPEEGVVADLLFFSSGIEPEICQAAELVEVLPGLTVPVAQAGHLVAMKVLATTRDRPQDAIDLRALISRLTSVDLERATAAVTLIERRGANRGRDLRADLARWLSDRLD